MHMGQEAQQILKACKDLTALDWLGLLLCAFQLALIAGATLTVEPNQHPAPALSTYSDTRDYQIYSLIKE